MLRCCRGSCRTDVVVDVDWSLPAEQAASRVREATATAAGPSRTIPLVMTSTSSVADRQSRLSGPLPPAAPKMSSDRWMARVRARPHPYRVGTTGTTEMAGLEVQAIPRHPEASYRAEGRDGPACKGRKPFPRTGPRPRRGRRQRLALRWHVSAPAPGPLAGPVLPRVVPTTRAPRQPHSRRGDGAGGSFPQHAHRRDNSFPSRPGPDTCPGISVGPPSWLPAARAGWIQIQTGRRMPPRGRHEGASQEGFYQPQPAPRRLRRSGRRSGDVHRCPGVECSGSGRCLANRTVREGTVREEEREHTLTPLPEGGPGRTG